MCDPLSIITGVLSIGQTAAEVSAENAAMDEAQRQRDKNTESAMKSAFGQYVDTGQRVLEEQMSTNIDKGKARVATLQDTATRLVMAGEGGADGHSVDSILASGGQDFGNASATGDVQLSLTERQLRRQSEGVTAQAQDRINAGPRVPRSSGAATALRLLGSGLGIYTDYKKRTTE